MLKKLAKTKVIYGAELMPNECRLSVAGVGKRVAVARLHGNEAFRGKMMGLGLVPGVSVTVMQGGRGRPLVLAIGGSRLVLDWKSAESVGVREVGCRPEDKETRS